MTSTRNIFARRHYRAVAEILSRAKARPNDSALEAIGDIEQDFADLFDRDHCKFKRTVFHGACLKPEAQ
jgi:hypothetical protein